MVCHRESSNRSNVDLALTVLVLLLRLRQICNHPALISEREEDLEALGRTRAEAEVERAVKSFGEGFVARVRTKIRDLETERMEAELTVYESALLRSVKANENTIAIRERHSKRPSRGMSDLL